MFLLFNDTNVLLFLDVFWLHIRCLGGWTNKLYDYFKQQQLEISEQKSVSSQSTNRETFNPLRRRIKTESINTSGVPESKSINSQDATSNSQGNKKRSISTPRVVFAPETLAEKV